ncbi:MAG TPA: hypothetical protein VJI15_01360 [Candidatus Nanoarchaeia archaeon]|nr:hypothetical protein [Candidatus Nanoarchaeia archaeon]
MSLANEAAYLYVYAKKLLNVNKKMKRLSHKAQKHQEKHIKATTEKDKLKHHQKFSSTTTTLKDLLQKHNALIAKLNHHQIAFAHQLRREHKL